jgi:hypothetical protein
VKKKKKKKNNKKILFYKERSTGSATGALVNEEFKDANEPVGDQSEYERLIKNTIEASRKKKPRESGIKARSNTATIDEASEKLEESQNEHQGLSVDPPELKYDSDHSVVKASQASAEEEYEDEENDDLDPETVKSLNKMVLLKIMEREKKRFCNHCQNFKVEFE